MGDIFVNPDDIKLAGRHYSWASDDWLATVATARVLDTSAFGTDRIGTMITTFHTRTNQRTVDYFVEVGECADDVGIALRETSDAYADVEATNAEQAARIGRELLHVGVVW